MSRQMYGKSVIVVAAALVVLPAMARAQEGETSRATTQLSVGTVSSIGRAWIVVRTDGGDYRVFRVEPGTDLADRPARGDRVRVVTATGDADEAPTALAVERVSSESASPEGAGATGQGAEPTAVPPAVRRIESRIERAARRYRAGVNVGGAIDPELISVGAFATFAPILTRELSFRPNVEIAFGEVTTLIALHFDVLYALRGGGEGWAPYLGAGPNVSFSHQSFEGDIDDLDVDVPPGEIAEEDGRFDFDDYDADAGFNFIVGARNPERRVLRDEGDGVRRLEHQAAGRVRVLTRGSAPAGHQAAARSARAADDRSVLVVLNFSHEPRTHALSEVRGAIVVSGVLDREGEPIDGSVRLRGDEGVIIVG